MAKVVKSRVEYIDAVGNENEKILVGQFQHWETVQTKVECFSRQNPQ